MTSTVGTGEPAPFDLAGRLPDRGITLLEASAGTGKTFTIAGLVARFVADGIPIDRILAVTFTRMATAELRGRVRDRLVESEERLRMAAAGFADRSVDLVDAALAYGTPETVLRRQSLLADAIANFDAATITTTHGFCHLVLASLGVSGGVGFGSELTEDAGDVVEEVVDDLYTRWYLKNGRPFSLAAARSAARAALANPGTDLAPAPKDSTADLQRRLAVAARAEVARRLAEASLLTYDDLLSRLSDALGGKDGDAGRGEAACRILRDRYDVVLVDEFQDTDPIQWNIVKNAFGGGQTILVLIGDPKQAIYSFRGGDVYSYLDAARLASNRFTLAENWRSDAGLIAAYDALLSPAQLGHPEIVYREVTVPKEHTEPGLVGAPVGLPLRIRLMRASGHPELVPNSYGVSKPSAEKCIAGDLAEDVARLLASEARLTRASSRDGCSDDPIITPGDIAVLVRTNRQAQRVQEALRAVGIPVVTAGADSVFSSPSAKSWLRLLEALEQPASRSRAAAAALTPFIGMSAAEVATADESLWEEQHARLHSWANVLRERGVAGLFRWLLADGGMPARVLREFGGPRSLTDLGHIAQLLHSESSVSLLGAPALRAWLSHRVDDTASDGDIEERTRRLESDADAVQVLTIHRAKGLEFPVVYCPYLWDSSRGPDRDAPVVYHDPDRGFERLLDVGTADPTAGIAAHRGIELDERRGEDLRLLYVALTRARHQAIVWWVRVKDSEQSPLYRVLAGRRADGSIEPKPRQAKDHDVEQRLQRLAASRPGCISFEVSSQLRAIQSPAPSGSDDGRDDTATRHLVAAAFRRSLDLTWRRTSYSAMLAGGPRPGAELVGSEPEHRGILDEPETLPQPPELSNRDPGAQDALREHPLPLAAMPGGTAVGTFVHRLLELVDFASEDLTTHIEDVVAGEWARRPAELGDPGLLVDGLVAAIRTPLGPAAGGLTLSDISRADRLDEVAFELPLAGGDAPRGIVLTAEISRLFAEHLDPAGRLRGYADRLAGPSLSGDLRGYLTGSLDLVFRQRNGTGGDRYFVADYKTNRLAGPDEALSAWHYRPEALDAAMQHAHYPLQAILYTVALHRYLRWRLPGYEPERNLGGVLYLFLRGMTGPGCPVVDGDPCGVFFWRPPSALVLDLSDLFDLAHASGAMSR
jgi:exodeoxyribonuclease V beta subunit